MYADNELNVRLLDDDRQDDADLRGNVLPDPVVATLHQRTEGWAAGLRLAALSLAGHSRPERFVAEFSDSDRTVAEYLYACCATCRPTSPGPRSPGSSRCR
jgi:LuxR family maltose regulon positive regulatory protein